MLPSTQLLVRGLTRASPSTQKEEAEADNGPGKKRKGSGKKKGRSRSKEAKGEPDYLELAAGGTNAKEVRSPDNFRDVQPLNPATRTIYRSSDASATCSAECTDDSSTCEGDGNSKKFPLRVWDTTLDRSWSYGDQEHWSDYTNGGQWVNG